LLITVRRPESSNLH